MSTLIDGRATYLDQVTITIDRGLTVGERACAALHLCVAQRITAPHALQPKRGDETQHHHRERGMCATP